MYEETVYLLDLCILSYHLHAQTLIWPVDSYYKLTAAGECSGPILSAETVSFGNLSTR
jgi:hypothetical protein